MFGVWYIDDIFSESNDKHDKQPLSNFSINFERDFIGNSSCISKAKLVIVKMCIK